LMKKFLQIALIACTIQAYSQDTLKIKQIDSIVASINKSNLVPINDSTIQDFPAIGLYMKTNLMVLMDGKELKKYVNKVRGLRQENGVSKEMNSSNAFYFDQGKLIKVEEYIIEEGKEQHADWYYSDDKSLYYTLQSDRSEERAALLLNMAKVMLAQIQK
jgi:hypothetical protein